MNDHFIYLHVFYSHLVWKYTYIYANVMGTVRITVKYSLQNNGKWFQDAVRDICIVPGIIAEGTISGVSYTGRMYNRSVQSWRDGGNTSRSWWMKRIQEKGRNEQQAELEDDITEITSEQSSQNDEEWESYNGPDKLPVEVWESFGQTRLNFDQDN